MKKIIALFVMCVTLVFGAMNLQTASKEEEMYFKLSDINFKVTNTDLVAYRLNTELILLPEVSAKTEDENIDYEMRSVHLFHNDGFNTHIDSFEKLKNKKYIWNSDCNENKEEAGCLYVFAYQDVTKGTIEIIEVKDDKLTIKWYGQANVFWNEKYEKNVPFETVFTVNIPKTTEHIIKAHKSRKALIEKGVYLELLELDDFVQEVEQESTARRNMEQFNSILKFKLIHNENEYLGEVHFNNGKNVYTTVFDEKSPYKVSFKGFDFILGWNQQTFYFEVLEAIK